MTILGIDIGSSSIKAGILRNGRMTGKVARRPFDTKFDGVRAEVEPAALLGALQRAIDDLGPAARGVDVIALAVFSPGWVAMDVRGKPITPIVTHQDRRSVAIAREIEQRIGKSRHLMLAGN